MVRVRFFAALREAAGEAVTQAAPDRLGAILDALAARYGPAFSAILPAASAMVDGRRISDRAELVPDGAELVLLPPFAGG